MEDDVRSKKNSLISEATSLSLQIREQGEKRCNLLKIQKDNYNQWRKRELKYLGKFLMIHNFAEHMPSRWEQADFSVRGEYDISCDIVSAWGQIDANPQKGGLELVNKIIKPKCKLHLKALACDAKLRVKLKGDSSLFIISRCSGFIESTSPVVKITRDTSLKGLFVMFGTIDMINRKFNYLKHVQIPEDAGAQYGEKNSRDLEVTFNDNGDCRLHLLVNSAGKINSIKQFVTFCDTFVPCFDKCRILIGGAGDSVKIKNFSLQQRERNNNKLNERPQDCCCRII
jgi:hypothetical protein